MSDTKQTNPKDQVGVKKLSMHLVPSAVNILASLAFTEGALKYGKYNWRVAGVRYSVYLDAIHRHLAKLQEGDDQDPETLVPHLASIIACCGILADAGWAGKLTDDRPPAQSVEEQLDDAAVITAHLKELFKDRSPTQYTISNTKRKK
jgi:hypothetical protein